MVLGQQKTSGRSPIRVNRIASREKIGMSGRERFEDLSLDPHLIDVMQRAHDKACEVLELGRNHDDAAAGLVLAKIIELAAAGETDPDRLCCRALMEVSDQMG
jgi:2-methylaconitate cis-trans-isomerase PrpF